MQLGARLTPPRVQRKGGSIDAFCRSRPPAILTVVFVCFWARQDLKRVIPRGRGLDRLVCNPASADLKPRFTDEGFEMSMC
jgi:hypothetical protein